MRNQLFTGSHAALWLTAMLTLAARATTPVKIDSIAELSFEVSPQTGRAGIRLEYIYPPACLGSDDSAQTPAPKIAISPGLTYDSAHARWSMTRALTAPLPRRGRIAGSSLGRMHIWSLPVRVWCHRTRPITRTITDGVLIGPRSLDTYLEALHK